MNPRDAQPGPSAALRGNEIVVYSPKARGSVVARTPQTAQMEEQREAQHLQQTVQNLLRQNVGLQTQARSYETELGTLRHQTAQAQQQSQMLYTQLTGTQQMLRAAQTQNYEREERLAGTVKSARLQIPCKEGPWTETQRLETLDKEVEHLRQFVEYQYQHEMLWGTDETRNPRFWYEKGGFWGMKTGPGGDGAVWHREPRGDGKESESEAGVKVRM